MVLKQAPNSEDVATGTVVRVRRLSTIEAIKGDPTSQGVEEVLLEKKHSSFMTLRQSTQFNLSKQANYLSRYEYYRSSRKFI